jgi:hypothetical protein
MVTAKRPAIEFKDGNIVVNVGGVPGNLTSDVAKLVSRLPGVTASNSEGITLNGKSATVYMDGRKQTLNSTTALSLLKSLPASSVDKIELISNNSGEYDAAEGAAIINIVSNKQRIDGYYLTVGGEGRYHNRNFDGGGNIFYMFKKKNILFNSTLSYDNSYAWNNRTDSTLHRTATIVDGGTSSSRTNAYTGNANLDWEFKRGHNLNFNFFFYDDFSKSGSNQDFKTYRDGSTSESYQLLTNRRGNDDLWSGAVEYSSPDSLAATFKAFYGIVYGGIRSLNNYHKSEDPDDEMWYMMSDADMIAHRHTIKFDYTQKLKDRFRIVSGVKMDLGSLDDDLIYEEREGANNYPSSIFEGTEDIYSGYLQFRANINKYWTFLTSARIEHTRYNLDHLSENSRVNDSFTNIFPYAHLSYTSESRNYNGVLAFLTSINRPNYRYMLPGIQYSNDYSHMVGNPRIMPETSYGIAFDQYFHRLVYLTLRYEKVSDVIGQVVNSTEDNVTEYRYDNYADNHRFYTSINVPFSFFDDRLTGNLSGTASYNTLTNPQNGFVIPENRRSFWSFRSTATANWQITKRLGVNVWGSYRNLHKTPQMDISARWSMDMGMAYSFLKDERLTLAVDVEDIFNSIRNDYVAYYDNSVKFLNNVPNSRLIRFSFILRFNRGEKIDDRAKGSQNDVSRFGSD